MFDDLWLKNIYKIQNRIFWNILLIILKRIFLVEIKLKWKGKMANVIFFIVNINVFIMLYKAKI